MAAALVTGWERDGKAIRLVPVKPKVDEVLAEFRRGFEAAVPKTSPLAELPVADLDATRTGELVLCGNPEAPCFRPSEDAFVNRLSAPSDRNRRMAMANAKGCLRAVKEPYHSLLTLSFLAIIAT